MRKILYLTPSVICLAVGFYFFGNGQASALSEAEQNQLIGYVACKGCAQPDPADKCQETDPTVAPDLECTSVGQIEKQCSDEKVEKTCTKDDDEKNCEETTHTCSGFREWECMVDADGKYYWNDNGTKSGDCLNGASVTACTSGARP